MSEKKPLNEGFIPAKKGYVPIQNSPGGKVQSGHQPATSKQKPPPVLKAPPKKP